MTFADTQIRIAQIYDGSDGDATKALFDELDAKAGKAAAIAINLFRAHKGSARAKKYRGGLRYGGGSFKKMAYGRKGWAMDNLCQALTQEAGACGIQVWGWGKDEKQDYHADVLYIDLPTGQVSFHTQGRGAGPDYPGQWDGVKDVGAQRIVRWIAILLDPPPPAEISEYRPSDPNLYLNVDPRDDADRPAVQKDLFS